VKVHGHPLVSDTAALAFAWSLVVIGALVAVSALGTRRLSVRPQGLQTVLEMIVSGLRSFVVGVMGPRGAEFAPFIGTLFIYIALMNLFGLLPGFMSPTANLSTTAALAVIVFFVVQYYGWREQGPGYLRHFVEGVPLRIWYLPLMLLVLVIHVVGEIFRPLTLALRLFGNMLGEETVVLSLIGVGVPILLKWWVPVPIQLPNLALGLITSLVQAMIFATLTAVYLSGVLRQEAENAHA
jgi:F-type H+-transporting ATPase subunit a